MPEYETAWTRTRILVEAKINARIVARLLNWNVPGVEAAILNYVLLEYDPAALAMDIREALELDNDPTQEIPALPG